MLCSQAIVMQKGARAHPHPVAKPAGLMHGCPCHWQAVFPGGILSTSQSFTNPFQMLEAIDVMLLRRHYKDAATTFLSFLDRMTKDWYGATFVRPAHYGDQNCHVFELCEREPAGA